MGPIPDEVRENVGKGWDVEAQAHRRDRAAAQVRAKRVEVIADGCTRDSPRRRQAAPVEVSTGVLGGHRFNFDFRVSLTEEQERGGAVEYNYRRGGFVMDVTPVPKPVAEFAAMSGTDAATYTRERPGMSAFVLEVGVVYHAYSTYARGLDGLWAMYQWLDRAP